MSSEKTKWYKTPPYSNIVGGVSVAAILGVLKLVYDWYTKTPILITFKEWFDFIISGFAFVLNFEIKVWWIAAFLLYLIILNYTKNKYITISKISIKNIPLTSNEDDLSDEDLQNADIQHENYQRKMARVLEYTADKFNRVIWRWDWAYNDLIKDHEIKNLSPTCLNIDCNHSPMEFSNRATPHQVWYTCPKCKKNRIIDEKDGEIETLIMEKASSILD